MWVRKSAVQRLLDESTQAIAEAQETIEGLTTQVGTEWNKYLAQKARVLDLEDKLETREMSEKSANDLFASDKCQWCGCYHSTIPACARVRSLQLNPNSGEYTVTFWPDGKWSRDGIITPDELAEVLMKHEEARKVEIPDGED